MPDTSRKSPRKIVLFSGHMIDAPGRDKPRFPPDKEPIAARAIAEALADLRIGPVDVAICGGACGGDLLFAEAARARGARLELHIPFDEPTFLENSVDFADRDWRARYAAVKCPLSFMSPRASSARSMRARMLTSATTAGCSIRRSALAPTRSIWSACGTVRAATGRAARVT
jgi:hypothetical protein